MPSKKRKYNARFPAGRIKKIMQTDEEVGKVAQAVPIIISRTLELFVESLLSKAMQVTMSRNARTLSPSHVKQCILSEARFDFLRDLVKNIPDVSAAEEKEMVSAESSPNSTRFSDTSVAPRRIARVDSTSSSSCDMKPPPPQLLRSISDVELQRPPRTATATTTVPQNDVVIDLSIKSESTTKPVLTPNFYQETLLTDDSPQHSVITVNPTYTCQPSTSNYVNLTPIEPVHRIDISAPNDKLFFIGQNNNNPTPPPPVTPILNIDFSKNIALPEFKLIDSASVVPHIEKSTLQRQNSKPKQIKKLESKVNDYISDNLQIDDDYDT